MTRLFVALHLLSLALWCSSSPTWFGMSTGNVALSSSSSFNATNSSGSRSLVATIPAVQRPDVIVNGFHPTLLLAWSFTTPNTASGNATSYSGAPCWIDIPLQRLPTTAPNPGPAHFFLWRGGYPIGQTATTAVRLAQETWIDTTGPTNAGGWSYRATPSPFK